MKKLFIAFSLVASSHCWGNDFKVDFKPLVNQNILQSNIHDYNCNGLHDRYLPLQSNTYLTVNREQNCYSSINPTLSQNKDQEYVGLYFNTPTGNKFMYSEIGAGFDIGLVHEKDSEGRVRKIRIKGSYGFEAFGKVFRLYGRIQSNKIYGIDPMFNEQPKGGGILKGKKIIIGIKFDF